MIMNLFKKLTIKPEHLLVGAKGERKARKYYKRHGYRILERNYRAGKHEIDIILLSPDKNILVFSEVKTRNSCNNRLPRDAVNKTKQQFIKIAANNYINSEEIYGMQVRFDVVEVFASEKWRINLIENAF